MSNGNGKAPDQLNFSELMPLPSSAGVINPQMYEDRMRNIQSWEERLALFKKQTVDAFNNYRHLQSVVEQGRQAERRLEELHARYGAVGGSAPASSLPGPSRLSQYATQPSEYSEIPTSARIEEVPNSAEGPSQSALGPSTAPIQYPQLPPDQTLSQQAYAYHQPQYPHGSPYSSGMSKANTQHAATYATSSAYLPYQQQQSYNSTTWTQSSQGMSQQSTQQDLRVSASATAPQSAGQPAAQSHRVTQANYEPQASGSGMGALHASNAACATQSAHNGTHSTKVARTTSSVHDQSHASLSMQQSAREHNAVNPDYEKWLFNGLQAVPPHALRRLMVEILIMVERKQQGGDAKSVRETMADESLDERMRQICHNISDQLKVVPLVAVRDLFQRLYDRIIALRQETEGSRTVPTNGHAGQAGPHEPPQPTFSNLSASATLAPVAPTSVAGRHTVTAISSASPDDAPTHVAPTFATSASVRTASPLTNSAACEAPVTRPPQMQPQSPSSTPLVTGASTTSALHAYTPSSSTSLTPSQPVAQANLTHMQWYQPSDPNAPQAYRDGNGNVRFLFTPQHNVVPAAPSTSSSQQVPSTPSSLPQTVVPPRPVTPPFEESRPEGALSPAFADKSRLAQDIIRSLGRPQANGKRRPTSDADSSTPSKRQRLGQHNTQLRSVNNFANPIPVDIQSVASSEPADVHQIQEAFSVSVAASDTSGPSSPGTRSLRVSSLGDNDQMDSASAAPPAQSLQASSSRTPIQSPSRAEKIPLFLPSPSSSSAERSPSRQTSPPPTEVDMMSNASSIAPRRPYDRKGKGRAREDDDSVIELSSRDVSRGPSPRREMAYVLMPPLPHYAKRLKTRNGARESSADSGSYAASESSEDELVVSDDAPISDVVDGRPDIDGDMIAVEEDGNDEDAEAAAVAAESHSCLRETPCQWAGCGAALNSMAALQTHLANHASDKEEWGTFACHWHGCLGNKFVDKARLLKHLWKHASVPLLCPYEGCNEQFDEAGELLQHQQEQPDKHRSGRRPSNVPTASAVAENVRLLSALPGVVPAYMSGPCCVGMYPISRERHQWLGARVLENIVCFKWQGRRSNAAVPSRGARRLAEKIAAAELAGSTPGGGLAYVRRLIDDEYLNFADGYSSGRHTQVYEEVPSAEVSQMVTNGLVLFAGDGDGDGDAAALSVLDATTSTGDHADSHPGASNEPSQPRVESFEVSGGMAGREAAGARGEDATSDRAGAEGEGREGTVVGERLGAGGSPPATSGTSLVLRLPSFKYSTSTVPQTTDSDMVVSPPSDQLEIQAEAAS